MAATPSALIRGQHHRCNGPVHGPASFPELYEGIQAQWHLASERLCCRHTNQRRPCGIAWPQTGRPKRAVLKQQATSEDANEVGSDSPANTSSLFTPQFLEVLQSATARQNQAASTVDEAPTAPTVSPAPSPAPPPPSQPAPSYQAPPQTAQEEVLMTAMRDSRRTLLQLEQMQKVIEQQIEREKKQFDRLHFAFKKAGGDAAYIRALQRMLDDPKRSEK